MELEKEVRYRINDKQTIEKIVNLTTLKEEKKNIDLVMGWDGFNSLEKYGFICRIRENNEQVYLQCKKKVNENEWNEAKIDLNSFSEGYQFLSLIGMKPYLYLNRKREVRKYGNLIVFIDVLDLLGTYVEIELQEAKEPAKELQEFLQTAEIKDEREKLYGDIFKEKLESDQDFRIKFEENLEKLIKSKKN